MKKLERAAGMFCTKPSRVVVRVMGGRSFLFLYLYWYFCIGGGVRHSSERGAGTVRRLRGRGIVVMNSVTFWKGNCKVKKA